MRTRRRSIRIMAGLALGLAACRATSPPAPTYDFSTGEDVVGAMHDRYVGRWYRTLTYVQHNTEIRAPGDTVRNVWLNAVSLPSRMRIDFVPKEGGNGVLFVRDTQYVMVSGNVARVTNAAHPLFLLTFDVYALAPAATLRKLRAAGFAVERIRQDEFRGRPVWVVGAAANDLRTPQFWVDREHMILLRLIDRTGPGGSTVDARLGDYDRIGISWIPRVIDFHDGDRLLSRQEHRQVDADVPLDSTLWVPNEWMRAKHWYQQPVSR